MRMQVILDTLFARPGLASIGGGKKGEFRDWTRVVNDLQQKKTTNNTKTKKKKLSKYLSIGVMYHVQSLDEKFDTNHSLKRPPCNHLALNRKFHYNSELNIQRRKVNYGGGVAMWFGRALDLRSGGPGFKSFSLPQDRFAFGGSRFNSSTLCKYPTSQPPAS